MGIEGAEAGGEFPVGPGEAACFGLAGDGTGPDDAGLEGSSRVRAEFAKEDGTAVLPGPGGDFVEVGPEGVELFVGGGPGLPDPGVAPGDPGGALMGEGERVVVVEGDDEALVVGWEDESIQVAEVVPLSGAEDDDAIGVGLADGGEGLRDQGVPAVVVESAVGFVEDFEGEVGDWNVLEGGGDLAPEGEEARGFGVGVLIQFFVMMEVDDGFEVMVAGLLDGPLDAVEECGVDGVGGVGRGVG